jgi:ligand-binding SRPBCC domain-containing protein
LQSVLWLICLSTFPGEFHFKRFDHDHSFAQNDDGTQMTDVFDYTSPLGILGRMADQLFLARYMKRLLEERNATINEYRRAYAVSLGEVDLPSVASGQ